MQKTLRQTTQLEKEVFEYLNDLRESGVTNMFGAAPYVEENFGIPSKEAQVLLGLWMKNFDADGNYETIVEQ